MKIEELETIFASLPGHVYWKNISGKYLGCNDQQAKALGLKSRHDIIYKKPYEHLAKSKAEQLIKIDKQVLESKKTLIVEEPGIRDNGEEGVFLTHKVPLLNNQNNVI